LKLRFLRKYAWDYQQSAGLKGHRHLSGEIAFHGEKYGFRFDEARLGASGTPAKNIARHRLRPPATP
jgi:hypothetical protein